ncbi:hyaluronan mediated motility receptor [Lepisosteus oculatus]|uniref:hyaluronan mediated motility receptor n=1 Tax=Lepisosteus oculatus TaxID=7918 RepID=UPI0035F520B3
MSFPRAPIKRFNEQIGCAPPPGTYEVKLVESGSKGAVSFQKSDRFKTNKDACQPSTGMEKMTSPMRRTWSADGLSGVGSQKKEKQALLKEMKQQKLLEKEIRSLVQQRGEQDKRLQALEEELRKVEAKLVAAMREKTGLAATVASLERQLADLKKANDLLKTKFSEDGTKKKMNALSMEILESKNKIDAKVKELGYMQINFEGQIKVLETDLVASRATVEAVKERNKALEDLHQEAKMHNEELEKEVDRLHALIQELRKEIQVLEGYLDNANDEIQELRLKDSQREKEFEDQLQLTAAASEEKRHMMKKLEEAAKELQGSQDHLKELHNKVELLQDKLSKTENDREQVSLEKAETEQNLSACVAKLGELDEQLEKHKEDVANVQSKLEAKKQEVIELKELLKTTEEELTQQFKDLEDKYQRLEKEKAVKEEESQKQKDDLKVEVKALEEKLMKGELEHQNLQELHKELLALYEEEKEKSSSLHELLEGLQTETQAERSQLETELEEALDELGQMETKEMHSEELIRHLEEENQQRTQAVLDIESQLNRKNKEIEEMIESHKLAMTKLREDHSNSLRKIGDMATELESTKKSMSEEMRLLEVRSCTLEEKVLKVTQQLEEEHKLLVEAEQSRNKAKEEYARMLLDAQTKLAQKDSELRKSQECHSLEMMQLQEKMERQNIEFQKELKEVEERSSSVVTTSEVEHWKKLYEELYAKVKPFQQQLDGFEAERKALLNENGAAQEELNKLADAYAQLLGHQNQRQKIKHVVKLKEENFNLKQEVSKLRNQMAKQKKEMEQLKHNQGHKRFDPSKAFKHDSKENGPPITPLKEGNRNML